MSENVLINNPMQAEQASSWRMRLAAASTAASMLAIAGCSSGGALNVPEISNSTVNDQLVSDLKTACGDVNLAEKSADTKFGSADSLFPSLTNAGVNGGPATFKSLDEIKGAVKYQVTHDARALAAIYSTVVVPRQDGHSADEFTLKSVKDTFDTISNDPVAQAKAEIEVCNATAFLEIEENFALTTGTAQGILTNRDTASKITGIRAEDVAGASVRGAVFAYNKDAGFTLVQTALIEKAKNLVVIDENGRELVNKAAGTGSFDLNPNAAPVEVKAGATATVEATPNPSDAQGGSNNQGQTGESNPGGAPSGGITTGPKSERNPNGPNPAPNPGTIPEATPGTDNTPNSGGGRPVVTTPAPSGGGNGNTPPGGGGNGNTPPGGNGGGTPPTYNQPPVTAYTPPATTQPPYTPPETTRPPYTPPATTQPPATTPPKGTVPPCVPNPPYETCNQ